MSRRIIIPVVPRNMFLQNCSCRMVILSLTQRKIPLAFFSARAHWWLMFNTVPIRTPSLPAKLLSSWAAPVCTGAWGCSSLASGILFIELHEVVLSLFLQLVKVPLDGSTTLRCISYSSQFITSWAISGKHSLTSSVIACCSLHVASVYSNSV